MKTINLTLKEWVKQYKPYNFPYGFVPDNGKTAQAHTWTLCSGLGNDVIKSGAHYVNSIFNYYTEIPFELIDGLLIRVEFTKKEISYYYDKPT